MRLFTLLIAATATLSMGQLGGVETGRLEYGELIREKGIKEFGITTWQLGRLRDLQEQRPNGTKALEERNLRMLAILTPWQQLRLRQISYQINGLAFSNRAVLKRELGITDAQFLKIDTIRSGS